MTISELTNTDKKTVRIFIVRHGQTDHNKSKILQGHLDVPLNETGFEQASKCGDRFKDVPIDEFLSSDLTRCLQTIQSIKSHHSGEIDYRTTKNLRERAMGEVEGMYLKDALEKYGVGFRNLGEKRVDLLDRLWGEWDNIIDNAISKDYKNILICTHGGVITNFINHLYSDNHYKLNPKIKAENLKVPFNTSVTVVDINKVDKTGTIQLFGDTQHLGEQLQVKEQLLR